MKRLLPAFALSLLLLSACGGASSSSAVTCAQQFWNGTVGMCLPAGWKVVDRETLDAHGIPPEVIAAFQADKAVSGQFPTVLITQEPLKEQMDSAAYSKASMRAVAALPGYKLIDDRSAKLDGAPVDLHIFTAQPIADEPERRFYQISGVSKGNGYSFTGLGPLSISSSLESQLLLMLNSATFTALKTK